MQNLYREWIGIILDNQEHPSAHYSKLLDHLANVPFSYVIQSDENRALNGINFRHEFAYSNGLSYDLVDKAFAGCKPSVLEVLVSLAYKCETDIMYDSRFGDRTYKWFWDMMANIHLDRYDDFHYNQTEVNKILTVFMNRRYDYNGENGGLFPIKNPKEDLRNVSLWYQMNWYYAQFV